MNLCVGISHDRILNLGKYKFHHSEEYQHQLKIFYLNTKLDAQRYEPLRNFAEEHWTHIRRIKNPGKG